MSETFTLSTWSLGDLFTAQDSPEMKAAFDDLEAKVAAFEALRPSLAADMRQEAFMDLVRQLEAIALLQYHIEGYASLAFAANTQDMAIQTFLGSVENRMAAIQNRTLFFSLWWKELEDDQAERLMAEAGDYHYWLEEIRHYKPHTLSEPEEKIINVKNVTGAVALVHLYETITNRYVFKLQVDGEDKEMTRGELMSLVRRHDPDLRAAAYQELYRVYGADSSILGQIYQNLARDWHSENVDMRHFSTPITARNLANDIPDVAVNTLLEVSQANVGVFQRYFQLKAKLLGMERLRRYDIYAPLAKSDKQYSFNSAAEMVFDAFGHFDGRIEKLARQVFEQNHLDSQVRKGKQSGAFCATLDPKITPWVLVNYQGKADDVATLAHELGHAIHAQLAAQHSLFTFHSSLPLAETASTFGEMLLVDRLMASETDTAVRRDLLFRQMDDAYATIMRQAQFALFEKTAHDMIHQDASVADLSEAYFGNLQAQFGEAVEVNDEFRYEWVSIPHFYHTPFYVYAYSFGQLLVLSLYQQYQQEGESFKPRYIKLLSAGGSQSPEQILTEAGIDMRSASFWQGGFDVLSKLVSQLEALPRG